MVTLVSPLSALSLPASDIEYIPYNDSIQGVIDNKSSLESQWLVIE